MLYEGAGDDYEDLLQRLRQRLLHQRLHRGVPAAAIMAKAMAECGESVGRRPMAAFAMAAFATPRDQLQVL